MLILHLDAGPARVGPARPLLFLIRLWLLWVFLSGCSSGGRILYLLS